MTGLIEQAVSALLQLRGIGPDSTAALLVAAGDNPDPLRGEASFTALCGASPIALNLPHVLLEWVTTLIVTREGDRRCTPRPPIARWSHCVPA